MDRLLSLFVKFVPIAATIFALLRILGWNPPPRFIRTIALCAPIVLMLLNFVVADPTCRTGQDFETFYYAGVDVRAGHDPYANIIPEGQTFRVPMMNPPSALTMFTAFTLLPPEAAVIAWITLNTLAVLGLVEFARIVLNASSPPEEGRIEPAAVAGLMAALALSSGVREGLKWGQVHILIAFLLMGAVYARAKARPLLAGLLLALASVKPQMLLPFLLLFHRKSDIRTWISMGVCGLALLFATTSPTELIPRIKAWQASVNSNFIIGGVNDYSDAAGWSNWCLVSLSHGLYNLGLQDRQMISLAQTTLVAAIGLGILFDFWLRKDRRQSALASLIACYSMIFIYHRTYDGAILALPLTYAMARSRRSHGAARFGYVLAAIAMLVALNPYGSIKSRLYEYSWTLGGPGSVLRAITHPQPTWGCLIALFSLWYAVRCDWASADLPVEARFRAGAAA